MRIPVLMGVEGKPREFVESYGADVYVEPENAEDFKLKLWTLLQPDKYASCQDGCTCLADAFDRLGYHAISGEKVHAADLSNSPEPMDLIWVGQMDETCPEYAGCPFRGGSGR